MTAAQKVLDSLAERLALEAERVRDEVRAGLAETRNALAITAARVAPLVNGSGGRLATGSGRLVGWSLAENAGTPAPARVTIYAGGDATGDVLAVATIAAGGGSNHGLPGAGVSFGDGGVFVVVTGTVVGSLYFGARD